MLGRHPYNLQRIKHLQEGDEDRLLKFSVSEMQTTNNPESEQPDKRERTENTENKKCLS